MPSKINGYPATTTATEPLAGVKARTGGPAISDSSGVDITAPAKAGDPAADHVTLTDSALQLQKLGAAVASAPVVDAARVAAVKRSVDSGTYQVNTTRVASKILGFETSLPGK